MGAKTSKFGSIVITLDNPYFVAGDYVNGKVHLDIKEAFFANELLIVIDGKEFASAEDRRRPLEFQNTIYANYMILHQFPGRNVLKGQYTFPFSFMLESHLPGTFKLFINKTDTAQVRYFLRAQITSVNREVELKHTSELIIRQVNKSESHIPTHNNQIRTQATCCVSQGLGRMKVNLDKNIYVSGGFAVLSCTVDNLLNPFNFLILARLVQVVTINGDDASPLIFRDVIFEQQLPIFRKKQSTTFQIKIPLLDKKGKQPLQPSTNGRIINCKYHIEIDPKYTACCTTQTTNNFILPLIVQAEGGISDITAPSNWEPITFQSQVLFVPNRDSFIRRQGKNPYIGMLEEQDQFK